MIKKEILINLISEKIEVMSEAQLKEVDKFIDNLGKDNSDEFDTFWKTWREVTGAKNQSKKTTKDKFVKAMRKTDLPTILKAITDQDNYSKEQKELGRFVAPWKHATTWLHNECWENEVDLIDWSNKAQAIEAVEKNPDLKKKFMEKNNRAYNEYIMGKY